MPGGVYTGRQDLPRRACYQAVQPTGMQKLLEDDAH
jgi:hypothetical protein